MMRESSVDKYNERNAGDVIERAWSVSCYETPKMFRVDYQIMKNGKHLAFGEYKCTRKSIKEKGEHYWIDFDKIAKMQEYSKKSRKPVILFVEFLEGIFWIKLEGDEDVFELGRYKGANLKPCSKIPIKLFQKLNENEATPI